MNDDFYEGRNDRPRRYGSQIKNSLSGMVIHSEIFEQRRDRAPLYAANPMVSGMGTIGDIVNLNSKVIVEAGEDNADLAKKIIEEMGGGLDTPAQKL